MYDIIGDIHGHADKLEELLEELGYAQKDGVWAHTERTLISVGDLVDRGPQQKASVDIIRAMVDHGHALCIMGNHEFNAVAYATKDSDGNFLRGSTPLMRTLQKRGILCLRSVYDQTKKVQHRI